jgi:hypothetical protein
MSDNQAATGNQTSAKKMIEVTYFVRTGYDDGKSVPGPLGTYFSSFDEAVQECQRLVSDRGLTTVCLEPQCSVSMEGEQTKTAFSPFWRDYGATRGKVKCVALDASSDPAPGTTLHWWFHVLPERFFDDANEATLVTTNA